MGRTGRNRSTALTKRIRDVWIVVLAVAANACGSSQQSSLDQSGTGGSSGGPAAASGIGGGSRAGGGGSTGSAGALGSGGAASSQGGSTGSAGSPASGGGVPGEQTGYGSVDSGACGTYTSGYPACDACIHTTVCCQAAAACDARTGKAANGELSGCEGYLKCLLTCTAPPADSGVQQTYGACRDLCAPGFTGDEQLYAEGLNQCVVDSCVGLCPSAGD